VAAHVYVKQFEKLVYSRACNLTFFDEYENSILEFGFECKESKIGKSNWVS